MERKLEEKIKSSYDKELGIYVNDAYTELKTLDATKKSYKMSKKEIVEESALNVGYLRGVLEEIPYYALLEAIKEISLNGWITRKTEDIDLENMLISESVKNMNYQDFKKIANYFYNFTYDKVEKGIVGKHIEISHETYNYLKENLKELLERKNIDNSLENKIDKVEYTKQETGNKVIGIDEENEKLLIFKDPRTVEIDEDKIFSKKILNIPYLSTDSTKQIMNKLKNYDEEIDFLYKEHALERDKYVGLIVVDMYELHDIEIEIGKEIDLNNYSTYKEYYNAFKNTEIIKNRYKNYKDFIEENYKYCDDWENDKYAESFIKEKIEEINNILLKTDSSLYIKEIQMQDKTEIIGYLKEIGEDIEEINNYIENDIEAYINGTLTKVEEISFDDIGNEKIENEDKSIFYVNTNTLGNDIYKNCFERLKKEYPKKLQKYKSVKEIKQEMKKEEKKEIGLTK